MRNSSRPQRFRTLAIEQFEEKLPLAGNVTAVLRGSDLILTGDGNLNGNQIQLTESGQQGRYVVEGLNGTKINQSTSKTFSGVTQDIKATFGNGPDVFQLLGTFHTLQNRDVIANMGPGNDTFGFGVDAVRNITVNQGTVAGFTDHDFIQILADGQTFLGRIGGNVTLQNGSGIDTVEIQARIGGNFASHRTAGRQDLTIRGSHVGGGITVANRGPSGPISQVPASTTSFEGNGSIDTFVGQSIVIESSTPGIHEVFADELHVGKHFTHRGTNSSIIVNNWNDSAIGQDLTLTGTGVTANLDESNVGGGVSISGQSTILITHTAFVSGHVRVSGSLLSQAVIERSVFAKDLSISGTSGSVLATIDVTVVTGKLTIKGGTLGDVVILDQVTIHGDTVIELGAGNDELMIENDDDPGGLPGSKFLGNVRIIGGTGRDTIRIRTNPNHDSVWIYGSLTIDFRTNGDAEDNISMGSITLLGTLRLV